VPFERFSVERVLAGGDHSSSEGRDSMIEELRPVFAEIPPSAMRMELIRMAAGRLEVLDSLFEKQLASATSGGSRPHDRRAVGRQSGGDASPRGGLLSRREDAERAFLALCVASPDEGSRALHSVDVDEHFASELLRRAARHLRNGDLREPMADPSGKAGGLDGDPDLKGLLAELVVEAGREPTHPAMLEAQRLQLELARINRQIQRARGQESGDVSELAHRRADVKREFDRANERALEETGDREG
jgi:DNA primase